MTDAEPAEHDSLLGTRIDGRYSVHRELGRGGMGVVYEGVHDDLGRPVAIKVLNLAWASDPTAVARFLREARTASSFSHPNIVDVTDLGRLPDGRPYLIMPKVTGTDLAAMLTQSGAQPAKRVAHLLAGVAQALDVIHAKGFVHRDIKPENLMYVVREDGTETVMLLDFGIAAAVMSNEPRLTGQGAIFGTPQFMPPEVCNGGMPDARGDVYALATVAFELITGVLPFGDDNMMRVLTAKLTSDPPSLSEASGVPFPPELEAVIARGLAREPRERFAHASEFIAALQASTEHAPVSWRSGVLRPSTRSAAHPVGSHPGVYPGASASNRPGSASGRPASGRPHPSSSPPFGRGNDADTPRHTPYSYVNPQEDWDRRPSERDEYGRRVERDEYGRPITQRDEYGRPMGRGYDRPSARDEYGRPTGRDYDPRSNPPEEHWATRAAHTEDPWGRTSPSLGAGLRESERFRHPSGVSRDSGGKRVAILLGVAAVLLGFLWYRHNQGLGLDGSSRRGEPPAADARAVPQQEPPFDPGASNPQPSQPGTPSPNTMRYAQPPAEAPQLENPVAAAGALPPSGDAVEHAATTEHAAELGVQAEAAAPAAANPTEAAGAVPAVPSAAMHGSTPSVTKPAHSWTKPQSAPSGVATKPVAPAAPAYAPPPQPEPQPEPPPPEEPVLRVEEKEPPPVEEPELPVRSPSSQAAQLAKDASTALLAGEVGHAIELLREATRLDPDQSLAWRTMGLAFERSGDTTAALAAYRQYIRLAPHGPQADMVRERMRVLESQ